MGDQNNEWPSLNRFIIKLVAINAMCACMHVSSVDSGFDSSPIGNTILAYCLVSTSSWMCLTVYNTGLLWLKLRSEFSHIAYHTYWPYDRKIGVFWKLYSRQCDGGLTLDKATINKAKENTFFFETVAIYLLCWFVKSIWHETSLVRFMTTLKSFKEKWEIVKSVRQGYVRDRTKHLHGTFTLLVKAIEWKRPAYKSRSQLKHLVVRFHPQAGKKQNSKNVRQN